MRRVTVALLGLAAAGCGLREPLAPPPGEAMPIAPADAPAPLTTEQLLAQPTIARPERVDELVRRSQPREDDRFDLPPPDVPVGGIPVPANGDQPEDGPE